MLQILNYIRIHLEKSALGKRFYQGIAWSVVGSVVGQGINLITMLFVARNLGKEYYGQLVLLQTTLNMLGTFAGLGIGSTATRYVAAFKNTNKERLGNILGLCEKSIILFGLLIALTIAFFSMEIAKYILKSPSLSMPIALSAIGVLFATLDGYQKSVLIGFESMRSYAISSVLGAALGMPLLIGAAVIYELNGAACALAVSALIQAGISRIYTKRENKEYGIKPTGMRCNIKEWMVLRDFALPALLGGIAVPLAHWICQTMLANGSNGFEELALLSIAMQWFSAVLLLPMVAAKVVVPMLTDYVTSGNHSDSKKILVMATKANALVALSIATIVSLLAPWIISLYGMEFKQGSIVLVIAVFTSALLSVQSAVGNIVIAEGKMWLGFLMNIGWAAAYIILAFFLIKHGAIGVIISMMAAYLIHSIWIYKYARRTM